MTNEILANCFSCGQPINKGEEGGGWSTGKKGDTPHYLCQSCNQEVGEDIMLWFAGKFLNSEEQENLEMYLSEITKKRVGRQ